MEGENIETPELEESMSIDDINVDDIKFGNEPVEETPEATNEETQVENISESDRPEATEPPSGQTEEPADAEVEVDEPSPFASLSKETGFEIGSNEDVASLLKEYAKIKDADPLESLSPGIRDAIKAEQAGMDLNHYFSVRSMDFEKMDGKEVMKQKFLRENAALAKDNPLFANKKFEREYQAKYGNLNKQFEDDEEKQQFLEENKEELEYAEMELNQEVKSAREEMSEWQKEATKVPEKTAEGTLSPEKEAELVEAYNKQVDEFFNEFNGIEIPLDGDKTFKVGFEGEDAKILQDVVKNPTKFLQKLGFGENGIDVQKLAPAVALFEKSDKLGKLLSDFAIEQRQKELITNDLEKPRDPGAVNSETPGVKDEWEQIGDAFESKYR